MAICCVVSLAQKSEICRTTSLHGGRGTDRINVSWWRSLSVVSSVSDL